MATEIDVPGIGMLREEPHGQLVSEPHTIAAFGGRACRFAFDGFEGDSHPEDFIEAVRNILAADERLLGDATPYVHQYCVDMLTLWGDEVPMLDITKPADVWRYVDLGADLSFRETTARVGTCSYRSSATASGR